MLEPFVNRPSLSLVALALALAILLVDLSLPLGVAAGVLYVALVLVGWWFLRRRCVFMLAGLGSILTVAGYFLSPQGGEEWVVLTNRSLSLAAIWVTAVLVARAKSNERRLRASEARLSGVIDVAPEAIILTNENQIIQRFNEGAARLFGYCPEEIIGRPIELLIPCRSRGIHKRHMEEFDRGEVARRLMTARSEIRGLRKDGTEFPAEASVAKLKHVTHTTYIVILHDISDRKAAEDMLEARAEELARSNADLERFAAIASHDLQEPLRMVASYTQLLAKRYQDKLDDDANDFIGYAVDGATRMQEMINDLLAYSRVQTRGQEPEPINSSEALTQAQTNLHAAIVETNAKIVFDPLPTVQADRTQMCQLFQNLIGNAIKYRRDLPPEIHISAARENGDWHFAVRDNGIGFESEYAEQVFEIFRRLHSRRESPGTGIGLAICKRIVERHHGRIWANSKPGEGTTFHFTIPANGDYADGQDS